VLRLTSFYKLSSYFVDPSKGLFSALSVTTLKLTEFWQAEMVLTGWRHASWTNMFSHMELLTRNFMFLGIYFANWAFFLRFFRYGCKQQALSHLTAELSWPLPKVLIKKKKTCAMDSHVNILVQLMIIPHGRTSTRMPAV